MAGSAGHGAYRIGVVVAVFVSLLTFWMRMVGKCGIRIDELEKIEAKLDKGDDSQSVQAGRCALTKTRGGFTVAVDP